MQDIAAAKDFEQSNIRKPDTGTRIATLFKLNIGTVIDRKIVQSDRTRKNKSPPGQ